MRRAAPLRAGILAQILFGVSLCFIKMGMAAVNQDTVKYLAFRFTVGFLCMTVLVALRVVKVSYRGKPLKVLLLCGLFNPVVSQVLETSSTTYAPTAQIAMLSSVLPIVVIAVGVLFFRERVSAAAVGFCALSAVGVFLASIGPTEGSTPLGVILIASTVVVVAFSRIFLRKARETFTGFEAIYVTTGMGALAFSTITLVTHAWRGSMGSFFDGLWRMDFLTAVLYMGICSCVIAFSLMAYSSASLSVEVYAALNTIYTVVCICVGVTLLHERLEVLDIVGTVVILAGVIGVNLCRSGEKKEPPAVPAQKEG